MLSSDIKRYNAIQVNAIYSRAMCVSLDFQITRYDFNLIVSLLIGFPKRLSLNKFCISKQPLLFRLASNVGLVLPAALTS